MDIQAKQDFSPETEEYGEVFIERLIDRAIENMEEKEREEFARLLASKDAKLESVMEYMETTLAHFHELLGQVAFEFEQDVEMVENIIEQNNNN